ncbi:MAG TPA: ABC transporter permease, partial [Bryobacteraceae bacterium]
MLRRLLNFFRARRLEADIRDEIEFHRAQSSGSFGNSTLIADHMRDASTIAWLENVWRDVRFAIRLLARSPVFTVTAILSLALGIGANTAIFSLADAVLLKQLPVQHPERLRMIEWSSEPRFDMPSSSYDGDCEMEHGRHVCGSFSYPLFQSIENLPQFAGVIGFADWELIVTADDRSESALGHLVSGNYFRVLGVKPLAGRILTASDDDVSKPLTAVISYRYWTRHFGHDHFIVGRVVLLN